MGAGQYMTVVRLHQCRLHRSPDTSPEHEEAVLRVWVAQYGLRRAWRAAVDSMRMGSTAVPPYAR